MMKFLGICFGITSLFCDIKTSGLIEEKKYSQAERKIMKKAIDEIEGTLEKELSKKLNLQCIGSGASMPKDIQELELDFILHKQTTIEEAREMEVYATERFVELINQNETIRPFLRDYPWDHHRACIQIAFRDQNSKDYPEGVRLIFEAKDKLYYFGSSRFRNDTDHIIKEEPYSEAKKIVKESSALFKKGADQPVSK